MTLIADNAHMARRLLARALITCIGLGAPAAASALPMYAYSKNEISSVVVQTGTARDGFVDAELFFATGRQSAVHGGDGLTATGPSIDAPQAKSGPGPFPGENDFSAWGEQGAYARADTCALDPDHCPGAASNVAEVFRPRPGDDGARAMVEFEWRIDVKRDEDVRISFMAWPSMHIKTSGDRENAGAIFDVFLWIAGLNDLDKTLFSWEPCGDADDSTCRERDPSVSVSDIADPFDLHQFIQCVGVCEKRAPGADEAPDQFFITMHGLGGDEGRRIVMHLEATETVRVWIPEPGVLALLGAGLLAAWATRGKRARHMPRA